MDRIDRADQVGAFLTLFAGLVPDPAPRRELARDLDDAGVRVEIEVRFLEQLVELLDRRGDRDAVVPLRAPLELVHRLQVGRPDRAQDMVHPRTVVAAYSYRNACTGSIRAARSAGIQAASAVTRNIAGTTTR